MNEASKKFPGLTQISRLVDSIDEKADLWLVYELGQKTLHERMYKIKREEQKLKSARPGEAAPAKLVACAIHTYLYTITYYHALLYIILSLHLIMVLYIII